MTSRGRGRRDPLRKLRRVLGFSPQPARGGGKGLAGAGTGEGRPAFVPPSCGMIVPFSAGGTEGRRGVRGEGAGGLVPLEPAPHPQPGPAAPHPPRL